LANLKELWRSSLVFRRIVAVSVVGLAALLVYLCSHIPRTISLPVDDLNNRSVARVGEAQIVLEKPEIAEGDLVLSYLGNKNEIADIWMENATLDDNSQRLLFPGSGPLPPGAMSYTTGSITGKPKSDETCHTTIEIRRAKGSAPVEALKVYQSDATAGAQRFRQIVLEGGKTPLEIEVHTDSPAAGPFIVDNLPGCHKLLTVSGNRPVDLPPIPIHLLVPSGKIDLHFNPANPSLPIWTGKGQTFEAVSLGDGTLRAGRLEIKSVSRAKDAANLDVRAVGSGEGITFSRLKLGSEMARLDIGRDSEKARAYADGSSLYNYDLIAAIQANPILSFAFAVVLVPALWKWVRKNCFPDMSD
jgi:hypothetical protein